jgi:hypothetical protein
MHPQAALQGCSADTRLRTARFFELESQTVVGLFASHQIYELGSESQNLLAFVVLTDPVQLRVAANCRSRRPLSLAGKIG